MWILLNCDSIFKNSSQNWTLFFEIRCHCEISWPSALIFFRNLKSLSLVFLSFFGGVEIGMKIHFMVGCFTLVLKIGKKVYYGFAAVKCKKNCLKLPDSSRNPIKKFYISKCHTLQNVKFEMSGYSNTTNTQVESLV